MLATERFDVTSSSQSQIRVLATGAANTDEADKPAARKEVGERMAQRKDENKIRKQGLAKSMTAEKRRLNRDDKTDVL